MKSTKDYLVLSWQRLSGDSKTPLVATFVLFIAFLPVLLVVLLGSGADMSMSLPERIVAGGMRNLMSWLWSIFVLTPFIYGVMVYTLKWFRHGNAQCSSNEESAPQASAQENCPANNADILAGFHDYARVVGTKFLAGIYQTLWMLLLIIPGIIKQYAYSMTDYVLWDNPDLSYNAAIEKSMQLMNGNKMRLFILDLCLYGVLMVVSFILLIVLGVAVAFHFSASSLIIALISFFIIFLGLMFCVVTYNLVLRAMFYEDLRAEMQKTEVLIQ